MKKLIALAMVGMMALSTMGLLAGDQTKDRKRAKDGSGDNCKLNAAVVCVRGNLDGNGKCQKKQKRDGSCSGDCCTE